MKQWRPSYRCKYVIPEVHGNLESFKIILNRILPLRFHEQQYDKVILLGDYIDKGFDSADIIDLLIDLKKEYGEHFICLKGNHEHLFLNAMKSEDHYKHWMGQGGAQTLQSYLQRTNLNTNTEASNFPFSRLSDVIPEFHIQFLQSLPSSYILDNYVFFHGGFDVKNPELTTNNQYILDNYATQFFKFKIKKQETLLQNKETIYVGSHNYKSQYPFIYSKYYMLGGGAPSKLIIFELNSKLCSMIKTGKSRIYKHRFTYYE